MTTDSSKVKRAVAKIIFVTLIQTVFLVAIMESTFAARTSTAAPDKAVRTRVSNSYWRLPLRFEANLGQTESRVRYIARGLGYNLFLTSDEAVFSLRSNTTSRVKGNTKREKSNQNQKSYI